MQSLTYIPGFDLDIHKSVFKTDDAIFHSVCVPIWRAILKCHLYRKTALK